MRVLALALFLMSTAGNWSTHTMTLPGGTAAGIAMDYVAFDPATNSVWVPAGITGAVDVIDAKSGRIRRVTGFATKEVVMRDRKRTLGPSAVAFGGGNAFIGNRGDSSICIVHPKTLARGRCRVLPSMPDGIAYVAETKEVWVTTPRDNAIRILDAATLAIKTTLTFDGNPEGFAVDAQRHRFYTNIEDKDRTLAIDLKSRKTVATWNPGCGEDGPHGIRLDEPRGRLLLACSAKLEVLDVANDGAVLSSIDTGDGVDDIDYAPQEQLAYAGAAKAAKLTVARLDDAGHLTVVATVPTAAGARNAAVTRDGVVYLPHGGGVTSNDLVVATPPPAH